MLDSMVGSVGGKVVGRLASKILLALRLRYQTTTQMTMTARVAFIEPAMSPILPPF